MYRVVPDGIERYGLENAVGLAVSVEIAVGLGAVVGVLGMSVSVGWTVAVKGSAVSVSGSVGCGGVTVLPGNGVGMGVRVATFGTQRVSPGRMRSPDLQLTVRKVATVV